MQSPRMTNEDVKGVLIVLWSLLILIIAASLVALTAQYATTALP